MSKQDKQKAQQLGKKYQTPCHGIGDCEFEAYQSALEMAEWKDKQWKDKAQTAFCYVHNCIGQCHNPAHPCELRQKFDDIMNGKWPAVEKTKTE